MALICRDVCRECVPESEFFEYGLWMPADKYRPDSDDEPESGSDDESGTSVGEPSGPSKEAQERERAIQEAAKSKLNQEFEKVSGGKTQVSAAEAGDVARRLGLAPSQEEIRMLREAKGDSLTQQDVQEWFKTISHAEDDVDHLIVFFQYYDINKSGKLSRTQIKNLLRSYGEPLTDQEIDAILSELGMTGEQIDYAEFVRQLLVPPA
eukprot:Protomagalhaensia_wolfi_Nauph_80__1021@NODE_1591_length_1453_cov_1942_631542_g138_i2_p1_GENE_NODE_1591_length_1453_cov_1942_631542_g138_i2NODE_1591_length_1453_cov_1942_631542_g138_i2_p1_ORF_typecomplete_len208_score46_18EFhand_7/PF13499_6/1_1EFhand_7/PF13499_6/7_8e10EFhand_11/PF08976_11/4_7e02EFhand_11/PF08976_11/2_5e08EFhand_8/PF13833_6/4_8EFhand_8/PF13833_6/0_00094EFhand_6/PF13405_6/4e03EFhand_6/PF13405_6/0_00033EFhand_6/PF13405_6/2_6e03EFhand_9/PF14658_6/6_8e03EFhand_9/PF14658_6/0_0075EFhand